MQQFYSYSDNNDGLLKRLFRVQVAYIFTVTSVQSK